MELAELQQIIEQSFPASTVSVTGDGYHFQVTVISDEFAGLLKVKRQQQVYQALNEFIKDGTLHAVTLSCYTTQEWEQQQNER